MFHLLHGLGWHSSQCWVEEPQTWCLQNSWNIVHMDVQPTIRAENRSISVLRPPRGVRRWAPNIAGKKLHKKYHHVGDRTRDDCVRIKHLTASPQRSVLFFCSTSILYTITMWLPSFFLLLSEDQNLIHRFLTSITMLQRQNDHVDDFNGLWLRQILLTSEP